MFEDNVQTYLKKYSFSHARLKAVLFDMDGVLFNSMPYHARAWAAAASQFGLHMTPEEAYAHEGRTGKSTINILARRYWGRNATDEEVEKIYAVKSQLFTRFQEAEPMPGAKELLENIRRDGFQILLVTGSGQLSLLDRLQRHFPGIFRKDVMVTSFDVRHGKPSPEPYLQGLRKAGVRPWEAMVVENAPLGVRSAVAAQIFTVALNTGPLPDRTLLDEGANLLLPSMEALRQTWPHLRDALQ